MPPPSCVFPSRSILRQVGLPQQVHQWDMPRRIYRIPHICYHLQPHLVLETLHHPLRYRIPSKHLPVILHFDLVVLSMKYPLAFSNFNFLPARTEEKTVAVPTSFEFLISFSSTADTCPLLKKITISFPSTLSPPVLNSGSMFPSNRHLKIPCGSAPACTSR